jgi:hypothetical protein
MLTCSISPPVDLAIPASLEFEDEREEDEFERDFGTNFPVVAALICLSRDVSAESEGKEASRSSPIIRQLPERDPAFSSL